MALAPAVAVYRLPEPIRQAIASGRAPSPPQVLLRLLQMVDDDDTSLAELARLVEQDPGLCTRVLTAANSPAIRRGQRWSSIESCLMALGTRLVRSIATCLSVQSLFDERSAPRTVELSAFWTHSLLIAELSRSLAASSAYPRPDEAYLAGLLHDVGELILLSALGEPYLAVLASCSSEAALQELESEHFGVHHGEIGTWLADQWQLDAAFADGILFHHASAEQITTAAQLPQFVWLAHELSGCDEVPEALEAFAARLLPGVANGRLRTLRDQAEQRMCVIADAIGMTPLDRSADAAPPGLPRVLAKSRRVEGDAQRQIAKRIGNQALMQPLQQDLFTLAGQGEMMLALREAARILFELNHVAFLLCDPHDGHLSGRSVAGQAPIFAQISILPQRQHSLAASAAVTGAVCSSYDRLPAPPQSLIDVQLARALASNGLLCIPMLSKARAVGVVLAGVSAEHYHRLSPRLSCLADFGRLAGVSLENWRAAADIRQRADADASARYTRQARRVIHEASNPLTIIKGYLKILDGKLPEDMGVRHELTVLGEEIDRVAGLIRRLSEAPPSAADESVVDVTELLSELLLVYRDPLFAARGIILETSLAPRAIRVACDRDGLKQMVVNLWKNASEALERGKRLRLSLTDDVFAQGRRYAELKFEDNGPGMSEAVIARLHRPAEGHEALGRGIGLSIVGRLASQLHIPVTCRSRVGEGTTISLLLPTPEPSEQRELNKDRPGLARKVISQPDTGKEQR